MKTNFRILISAFFLFFAFSSAWADKFSETRKVFEDAGTLEFFENAHGYALFPTIGKAGMIVGGAYGEGRVYEQGTHVGDTEMTQITAGFQAGASSFSQVIFFEDSAALVKFTNGNFEFGLKVQAIVLTASADVSGGTAGGSATASANKNQAITEGNGYLNGMAVFTITKGGLMYELSVGGQKFKYKAL